MERFILCLLCRLHIRLFLGTVYPVFIQCLVFFLLFLLSCVHKLIFFGYNIWIFFFLIQGWTVPLLWEMSLIEALSSKAQSMISFYDDMRYLCYFSTCFCVERINYQVFIKSKTIFLH